MARKSQTSGGVAVQSVNRKNKNTWVVNIKEIQLKWWAQLRNLSYCVV